MPNGEDLVRVSGGRPGMVSAGGGGAHERSASGLAGRRVVVQELEILVVEDDPSVRGLLERLLIFAGHRVQCATNAREASAFILFDIPQVPDLALLDIVLPGMSGVEYAIELRRLFPAIRILFMTGWEDDDREHHADARRLGPILYKPFDRVTLLDAVQRV